MRVQIAANDDDIAVDRSLDDRVASKDDDSRGVRGVAAERRGLRAGRDREMRRENGALEERWPGAGSELGETNLDGRLRPDGADSPAHHDQEGGEERRAPKHQA